MQKRERILAIILSAAVAVYLVPMIYQSLFTGPLATLKTDAGYWDNQVAEKEAQIDAILRAKRQMKEWGSRSLPPDPLTAQRLYQQWLTDLAVSSGLSDAKITPERISNSGTFYAPVRVGLECKATYEQLCTFLHSFQRAGVLHRIRSLKAVRNAAGKDSPLDVTLTAEGLSLPNAVERKEMFARTELAGELSSGGTELTVTASDGFPQSVPFTVRVDDELLNVSEVSGTSWSVTRAADNSTAAEHAAGAAVELVPVNPEMRDVELEDHKTLLAFNPFVKAAKSQEPDEPQVATDETAKSTRLVGYFAEDDNERAVLYDSSSKKQTLLFVGSDISVGEIRGKVIDLEPTYVLLRIDEETFRLNTGDIVSAMKKTTASAESVPKSTGADNSEPAATPQESAAESS